ncbi:hypothetical protein pqer_cds_84 [Pandoravirus quercus]|uniref:Uncharacterized protein n=1 Tax=Pandoravirus quercus TaxID=2107709 RepID=A0A2U7U7V5_9VIRU|nr:hypothetical protein pqer_cds_84 [Pandoravirus quercus]AVK74506.1 hypothetical protein pqer_cds_84 [Pandoravirus quercus]
MSATARQMAMGQRGPLPPPRSLLTALTAGLQPEADGAMGGSSRTMRSRRQQATTSVGMTNDGRTTRRDFVPATSAPLPPEWASLGDRLVCLLGTEPAVDVLDAYGMDRWDAGGCGVLAAALAPVMAQRGVPNARSYGILVPNGSGGARVLAYVVGNSPAGPFFDAAGWHSAEAVQARAGRGARIVPMEAGVGPVAGPTGVVCPHGAVRDLRLALERYLDVPFIVLYNPVDALVRSVAGERSLPQLWTWDDRTTASRLYLVTPDGPMPVNEQGTRLPPHYAQIAGLARQDPRRQSCLVLGAPKATRPAAAQRRHPTV